MRRLPRITFLICLGLYLPCSGWAQSSDPAAKNPVPPDAASSANSSPDTPAAGDSTRIEPIKTTKPIYPPEAAQHGIHGRVWVQVLISETGDVTKVEVISGDPELTQAAVDAVKQWKFKPFIKNGKPVEISAKLPMNFGAVDKTADSSVPPPSDSNGGTPPFVRVSQGVSQGLLITRVQPVYPEAAKYNRILGSVVLQAMIGKDGHILDLKAISGPPELIDPSLNAVRQWRYKPYMFKNEPVEVQTTITVNYTLSSR